LHSLQIFGEQIKFPLLAADGVVLGVVLEVVLGVVLGVARGVALVSSDFYSSLALVLFAHTSGVGDPQTAVFVEMS